MPVLMFLYSLLLYILDKFWDVNLSFFLCIYSILILFNIFLKFKSVYPVMRFFGFLVYFIMLYIFI